MLRGGDHSALTEIAPQESVLGLRDQVRDALVPQAAARANRAKTEADRAATEAASAGARTGALESSLATEGVDYAVARLETFRGGRTLVGGSQGTASTMNLAGREVAAITSRSPSNPGDKAYAYVGQRNGVEVNAPDDGSVLFANQSQIDGAYAGRSYAVASCWEPGQFVFRGFVKPDGAVRLDLAGSNGSSAIAAFAETPPGLLTPGGPAAAVGLEIDLGDNAGRVYVGGVERASVPLPASMPRVPDGSVVRFGQLSGGTGDRLLGWMTQCVVVSASGLDMADVARRIAGPGGRGLIASEMRALSADVGAVGGDSAIYPFWDVPGPTGAKSVGRTWFNDPAAIFDPTAGPSGRRWWALSGPTGGCGCRCTTPRRAPFGRTTSGGSGRPTTTTILRSASSPAATTSPPTPSTTGGTGSPRA